MPLSLSKKATLIAQSEIRTMTIACAKIGRINLAQGVCDTEAPLRNMLKNRGYNYLLLNLNMS